MGVFDAIARDKDEYVSYAINSIQIHIQISVSVEGITRVLFLTGRVHYTTLQHTSPAVSNSSSVIDTLISPSVWAATNGVGSCYGDGYGTRWSGARCTMMRGRGRSGSGCCGGLQHGMGYDTGLHMGGDVIVRDKENTINLMCSSCVCVVLGATQRPNATTSKHA